MCFARPRIVLLVVATLTFGGNLSFAAGDDRPVDVSPGANVDEDLFVLRAFARVWNQWPRNDDPKAALQYCAQGRVQVNYLRSVVAQRGLDAGIRGMCDDFLDLLDEYETALARLGEIDRKAQEKAFSDAVATFVQASLKGLDAGLRADAEGKTKQQVESATERGFVVNGVKDYIKRSNERTSQTNSSKEEVRARFGQVIAYAEQRNGAAAQAMTARHHWAQGEAGFDMKTVQPLNVLAARRPRDPFAKLSLATEGVNAKTTANELIERARLCLEAVRLIPDQQAYRMYRMECLETATLYACNAAGSGVLQTYRDAPTQYAQEAINITRALLQADPVDSDGWERNQLIRALADAGRFHDAIATAQPLLETRWRGDLGFVYRYARLMGVTGDAERAEQSLRNAYMMGYGDVNFVKASADFECLRTQKPEAYAELTTPKARIEIEFHVFNDDVIIHNDSPFPLTNAKLKLTVIQGGKIWQADKAAYPIAAKYSTKIENVFNITGSHYDRLRWTLTSDQGTVRSEE